LPLKLLFSTKIFDLLASYFKENVIEAGCDEAGRGCLAGPVVAAAVILPPNYTNKKLNDSKKLSEKVRDALRVEIEAEALAYAVAFIDNDEIDQINIQKASIKAMHVALDNLNVGPEHVIVDGNRFYSYQDIPHTCVIKGDGKYFSIAAASILAKTYRDEYMVKLSKTLPEYGFERHKGYPTKVHRAAILKHGVTSFHRKTFQLLDKQLQINF